MEKTAQALIQWAPWAACALFGLLLIWYLIRFFAESAPKPRRLGRALPKAGERAPLWKVLCTVFALFLLSRALLFLGGYLYARMGGFEEYYLTHPATYWTRWDADHYIGLIRNWYVNEGDPRLHIVFFPLYPALGRIVYLLSGLDPELIAYLVSNVCFFLCGIVLFRLTELTWGSRAAMRAVTFFYFTPLSLFGSVPYTESAFLLTTLLTVYLARKKHFFWALLFGAMSSASRMCGMATAVPIFYELLKSENGRWYRRYGVSVLKTLPVSLGLLSYLALNWEVTGDPFRFLTYQSEHWGQNFGSLFNTVRYSTDYAFHYGNFSYRMGVWIPQVVGIFLVLLLFLLAARRSHPGDMGYALVYFYVSTAPTWLLSGPRYLTALYVLYPLLAVRIRNKRTFGALLSVLSALLIVTGGVYSVCGWIL